MPTVADAWLQAGAPRVVLRLAFGSRDIVVTDIGETFAMDVRGATTTLVAVPGLTVQAADLERLLTFGVGEDGGRSASVSLVLPFDVAQEVEAGADLAGCACEMAQVWPGMAWSDRRTILVGVVSEQSWGGLGEPIDFTIEADAATTAQPWPGATWYVSSSTWPREVANRPTAYAGTTIGRDASTDGQIPPLVIGYPGSQVSLSALSGALMVDSVPAVPALYVEGTENATVTDHAILAAMGPVRATDLTVFNLTAGTSWQPGPSGTITYGDNLGQHVTYAIPPTAADIPIEGDKLYTSWPVADGGGMPDPFGTGPLRRMDHVLRWCLLASGLRVDHSRLSRLSALRAINVDTYLNEAVDDLWTWARANLLPHLPARAVEGPGGHYCEVFQLGATASQAVAHLEEGRNAERLTRPIAGPLSGVRNKFVVSFAPNLYTNAMVSTRTLTGYRDAFEAADPNVMPDYTCQRSHARFGVRPEATVDVPWLYDPASAVQILAWKAQMYATPPIRLTLHLGGSLDWLEPGDVVTVTSSTLHWAGKVGHVEIVSPAGAGVDVQVVVLGVHAFLGAGA